MTIKRLIGSAPSQVSRNKDLGTMAWQDASLVKGPAFSVRLSSNQSLTAAAYTILQLNTIEYDTNNCYNTSTYQFKPTVAGYYFLHGKVGFTSSVVPLCQIYKNGSAYRTGIYFFGVSGGVWGTNVSSLVYLNGSTDYVSFVARTEGASTVDSGTTISTYFDGFLARPA